MGNQVLAAKIPQCVLELHQLDEQNGPMKVVATAPIPGRRTPSLPCAGSIARPVPGDIEADTSTLVRN
jgi:hypothetical protein